MENYQWINLLNVYYFWYDCGVIFFSFGLVLVGTSQKLLRIGFGSRILIDLSLRGRSHFYFLFYSYLTSIQNCLMAIPATEYLFLRFLDPQFSQPCFWINSNYEKMTMCHYLSVHLYSSSSPCFLCFEMILHPRNFWSL